MLAALVLSLLSLVNPQFNFISVLSLSVVIFLFNWFVVATFSLIVPVRPRLRGQTVAKPTTTKKEEDFHVAGFVTGAGVEPGQG